MRPLAASGIGAGDHVRAPGALQEHHRLQQVGIHVALARRRSPPTGAGAPPARAVAATPPGLRAYSTWLSPAAARRFVLRVEDRRRSRGDRIERHRSSPTPAPSPRTAPRATDRRRHHRRQHGAGCRQRPPRLADRLERRGAGDEDPHRPRLPPRPPLRSAACWWPAEQSLPAGPIALGDDLLIEGDSADVLPRLPAGRLRPRLHRSAVQHRAHADAGAPWPPSGPADEGDRTGFGGRRYRSRLLSQRQLRGRVRRLPGVPGAPPAPGPPAAGRARHPLPARRLPRGALLQARPGRAVRPRLLPQRDHLGLRLRRPSRAAAGRPSTTRSWSTSVPPAGTGSMPTRWSESPTWRRAWSVPRRAARGKMPTDVFWHTIVPTRGARRPATRPRSRREWCAAGQRLVTPGRLVRGLLRRLGNTGRGVRGPGPPLRAGRLQPRSGGDRGPAALLPAGVPARQSAAR